jgi:hypothetical protein
MKKVAAALLVLLGVASMAWAHVGPDVPEIDPGSLLSASALIGTAVLMIRGRRKS